MITLTKLLSKVVAQVNEVSNHSITEIQVENAAAAIDDYLGIVWEELTEKNEPWRLILEAFDRSYEDEKDNAVTFTAYMVLTRCMLEEKLDAVRLKS